MSAIAGTIYGMLRESRYTVVLSGRGMLEESGYPVVRDGGESYAIEEKYGYSAEEIFSSAFFSTRKQQFYEFYRNRHRTLHLSHHRDVSSSCNQG